MKLLGLLLFLLLPIRLPAQIDPHPVLPDGLGVNIHFTDPRPGEMKMLAESGARWIRMDIAWAETEREKGVYDFARWDTLLAALQPYHIRALLILVYYNPHYDGGVSPHTDEGRQAFARWAAAAATHFKGRGILWEMYNEPNDGFWKPRGNTQDYIKLALAVGEAILEAAPEETYIGPAGAGIDLPFLQDCFKAGLLNYWPAVSVHPYRQQNPETVADGLRALRGVIAAYAPKGKKIPILAGEWGYSSVWNWKGMNDEKQGKLLAREWLTNLANDVPISIWYDWRDDGEDPKDQEHHFGMVYRQYHEGHDPVYRPKPAYLAARTLCTALAGFRFNKRLAVAGPDDYVLLFSRPGDDRDVRLVAWTTSPEARRIEIPASPGRFRATGWTGNSQPNVSATLGALSLLATDAPQYLAPLKANALLAIAAAWERLPLEIRAPAPEDVPVTLHLRNPLARMIQVRNGHGGNTRVPAGAEVALTTHASSPERSPNPTRVRIEWKVEGMGRIAQEILLLTTNPLVATPLPPVGSALAVRVQNISGQPFSGVINLININGLVPETTEQPLTFRQGETDKLVSFNLRSHGQDFRVGLLIKDERARPALHIPASRFVAANQFPTAPDGAPPDSFQIVADGDPKVASQQSLAISGPPGGPPLAQFDVRVGTLRIAYHFEAGWKFLRVVPKGDHLATIPGQPKAFGLWIYGDGQGNQPMLRLIDATGQVFQGGSQPINWIGWRYTLVLLDADHLGSWGGAADGVIHYPIRWDTLFLIDSAHHQQTTGVVYIAAPTLVY